MVLNTLREWKLGAITVGALAHMKLTLCPKSEKGLVFPSSGGMVEHHKNIVERGLAPTQIAAGVTIKGRRSGRRFGIQNQTRWRSTLIGAFIKGTIGEALVAEIDAYANEDDACRLLVVELHGALNPCSFLRPLVYFLSEPPSGPHAFVGDQLVQLRGRPLRGQGRALGRAGQLHRHGRAPSLRRSAVPHLRRVRRAAQEALATSIRGWSGCTR